MMLGARPLTWLLLVQPRHRGAPRGHQSYIDSQSNAPSTTPREKAWGSWGEGEDGRGRTLCPLPSILPRT